MMTPHAFWPATARTTAKLECPRCGAPQYRNAVHVGQGEATCERCHQKFFVFALPKDATGDTLRPMFGDAGAAAIVRLVLSHFVDVEDEELWRLRLTGHDAQAYLCITVSPRQLHLYRQEPVERLAVALALLPRRRGNVRHLTP